MTLGILTRLKNQPKLKLHLSWTIKQDFKAQTKRKAYFLNKLFSDLLGVDRAGGVAFLIFCMSDLGASASNTFSHVNSSYMTQANDQMSVLLSCRLSPTSSGDMYSMVFTSNDFICSATKKFLNPKLFTLMLSLKSI